VTTAIRAAEHPSSPGGRVGACDVAHATDGSSAGKADGSRP